jgi:hypothetical protein
MTRPRLPLAVRLRDEAGPPLPQMVAQRRAQLERDMDANDFRNESAALLRKTAKQDDAAIRERLLFHAERCEECGHLNAARYMRLASEAMQALAERVAELERSRSYEGWR